MSFDDTPPKLKPIKLKPIPPHMWRKSEDLMPPYREEVEVYCPKCHTLAIDTFWTYADGDGGKDAQWGGKCLCENEWQYWRPLFLPNTEAGNEVIWLGGFDAIVEERHRQNDKWGIQTHDLPVWMLILGEEYGEACQAVLKLRAGDPDQLRAFEEEIVQCAAVSVQILEYIQSQNENGQEP